MKNVLWKIAVIVIWVLMTGTLCWIETFNASIAEVAVAIAIVALVVVDMALCTTILSCRGNLTLKQRGAFNAIFWAIPFICFVLAFFTLGEVPAVFSLADFALGIVVAVCISTLVTDYRANFQQRKVQNA